MIIPRVSRRSLLGMGNRLLGSLLAQVTFPMCVVRVSKQQVEESPNLISVLVWEGGDEFLGQLSTADTDGSSWTWLMAIFGRLSDSYVHSPVVPADALSVDCGFSHRCGVG